MTDDYREYIIETYHALGEPSHQKVRARLCAGQGVPTSLKVRCSTPMRKTHPVGTKFKIRAKLTDREGGGEFLHAPYDWPYVVVSDREADEFIKSSFLSKREPAPKSRGNHGRARSLTYVWVVSYGSIPRGKVRYHEPAKRLAAICKTKRLAIREAVFLARELGWWGITRAQIAEKMRGLTSFYGEHGNQLVRIQRNQVVSK